MPPAIMVQRFCIMLAAILSSVLQVIFMPPVHFSIVIVQRGTIIQLTPVGIGDGAPIAPVPVVPMPARPIPARSIIIALVMAIPPR
jgi:hypothetical protein